MHIVSKFQSLLERMLIHYSRLCYLDFICPFLTLPIPIIFAIALCRRANLKRKLRTRGPSLRALIAVYYFSTTIVYSTDLVLIYVKGPSNSDIFRGYRARIPSIFCFKPCSVVNIKRLRSIMGNIMERNKRKLKAKFLDSHNHLTDRGANLYRTKVISARVFVGLRRVSTFTRLASGSLPPIPGSESSAYPAECPHSRQHHSATGASTFTRGSSAVIIRRYPRPRPRQRCCLYRPTPTGHLSCA
ncbi:hypothetical protein F4860DRAFT_232511 [Xylaria cubensis]|nr:hypothetical protein F4860DRAFT_232511 [Xylaria cubensis]